MHFKSVALLFSLALSTVVLAAPIDVSPADVLYPRAIAVVVEPDPTGDFKTLLTPPPKAGAAPPKGCPKPDMANWKKLEKKCKTYDALHLEFSTQVTARVTAAIHAAESKLKLTGPLQVKVKSTFHHNAAHDPLYHWTFSFSAPSCGSGPCVGHAYEAGAPKNARIFSADHRTIFDA